MSQRHSGGQWLILAWAFVARCLIAVCCLLGSLTDSVWAQEIDKSCETTVIFGTETIHPTQNCLEGFQDFEFDSTGNLWVADELRILRFPEHGLPLDEDTPADIVIGRPDFTTVDRPGDADECSSESNKVCWLGDPRILRFDNTGHLWVVDGLELLRFSPPFRTAMAADFSLNRPGINLSRVDFLFDQGGNLWIAEVVRGQCSRVVRYRAPVQPESVPDLVIGQANLEDACLAPAPGPRQFHHVGAIVFDEGGNLLVVDNRSNRILVFEPPFSNFMEASAAIGQKNLTDFDPLPFDDGGLFAVQDMEVDVFGQLWTLQYGFFVSVFSPPFTTGQNRSYWFDGQNRYPGQPEWPFMSTGPDAVHYLRFGFQPDRSIRFFHGGGHGWTARLEVPLLAPDGVVHAANFLPGPLSPGQIASAYGVQVGFHGGLGGVVENGQLLPPSARQSCS